MKEKNLQLLIPVAAGLEQIVKRQLFSLGFERAPAFNGRIETEGDWQDVARLNVFLRSGERVLIKLREFPARTFDELYDNFYAIPWEDWLSVDSKILMDGKSVQSALAAVKAAIALMPRVLTMACTAILPSWTVACCMALVQPYWTVLRSREPSKTNQRRPS